MVMIKPGMPYLDVCRRVKDVSTSTGIIAAIETPTGIGKILTMAFPLAVLPPKGNLHVFSL